MIVIGITGGVGSGKSLILQFLEKEYHAVICQADEIAKLLQQSGQPVFCEMVKHFGEQIVNSSGELDRETLRNFVFRDASEMQFLNQLIHPKVKEYILQEIQKERKRGTRIFIIEAALLIDDNYDAICDEMWYIHTDESVRRSRLKVSRGYTDSQIDAIISKQLSEEAFRENCPVVIENSSDFVKTKKQLQQQILESLKLEEKMEKYHEVM